MCQYTYTVYVHTCVHLFQCLFQSCQRGKIPLINHSFPSEIMCDSGNLRICMQF